MKKTLLSAPSNFSKFYSRVLFLLLLIGGSMTTQAQVSSYVYSESTGNAYTDLTTGTVVASGAYGTTIPLFGTYTLPFTFYYNNIGYTSVSISDNGFIILGAVGTATVGATAPISANTTNDSAISCYGANLVGAATTSEIRCNVLGSSPNRVFVVQYKDVQRRPSITNLAGLMNMQIRLYETTGVVETVYRDAVALSAYAGTSVKGEVGLRGAGGNTDYNARTNAGANWTPTTAVATNVTPPTMTTGTTNTISAGTKFTWTPCFNLSSVVAVTPDNSTLNISWTAPNITPLGGYDYEVRTAGNPGSGGGATLFASGNTSSNSVSILGMAIGVTYYVYVKANCRSIWLPSAAAPSSVSVTPVCTVATLPYTQNFEGVIVNPNTISPPNNTVIGGYPACNSLVTTSGGAMGVTNNSTLGYYGFNNKNLITTGAAAQNAWYFTQIMNFPSAGSYKLTYKYGGSREQTFFQQKMKVYYGSVASAAGMTNLLADHADIKTSPENNTINFLVTVPGNYYVGFNSYAIASQGYLQLDDITVSVSTCLPPTALTSGQVSSGSAVIAWTAPASLPGGYEYYLSTSNTPPISTTNPTGNTILGSTLVQLNGLTPTTTYYYWVRSVCTTTDKSIWTTAYGTFTTTTPPVYCSPSGFGFGQDPNGITNVTMGSINNTTGIETNNYRDYSSFSTNVAQGDTVPVSITYGTGFTYDTAIWVDWNNDGDFSDTGENVFFTLAAPANSTAPIPTIRLASFVVPALDSGGASTLGPHRVRIGGIDEPTFTGGALTPCRTGQFQVFEDYSIFVTVPPPALSVFDGVLGSVSNTICAGADTSGSPLSLSSNPASYQVYTWSPNNGTITGNILNGDLYFSPTTTTTYILTASQTSGNFSSKSVAYTVYVNPLPTAITVAPAAPTVCQSDAPLQLVASGGIVPGVYTTIINEDFNGVTNTFTTVNNSVNGTVANAAWTTHPSPFNYNFFTFSSNDSSQFYLSNSDSQGSVGTTNTELISPVFSLVGFTDASVSFWHHYRSWSSGVATVEVSTDGGTTYTILPGTSWTTVSQGNTTGFVNVVLSLSSYVGQANMKIRFKYANAQFGWFWAIDNVKVYGTNSSSILWSPSTNLYTDAAGTIPYPGDGRSTVYFKPGTTTSYTLESDSLEGCITYGAVNVTVVPISGGTTSGDQTLSCSTAATDITVSGYSGTVTGWQYSSSPTFATGITPIANPSATLTAGTIGSLTSTRYYRAVVTNGSCTAYSTISGIIVTKTVWTSGGWTNGPPSSLSAVEFQYAWPAGSGDVSACSVLVSTGAVVAFGPGETLTVQGEVKVNPGCSLTFANTASLYQVLDVANQAGTYNGNGGVANASNGNQGVISYSRTTPTIREFDYVYWSSPVGAQNVYSFASTTNTGAFFHWNSTTQAWNYPGVGPVPMTPGKGYIIRAPDAFVPSGIFTGTFLGVPNSGTIPFTAPAGATSLSLVGNPYPSAMSALSFITDPVNSLSLNGTLYFWTHNTDINNGQYTGADYATFNALGGAASASGSAAIPSGNIGSGVGFFVKSTAAGGVARFRNSMRMAGTNTEFFKLSGNNTQNDWNLERHRYWLDITNTEGAFKQVLVGYTETATLGMDRLFDGEMVDSGNVITMYTMVDTNKLTIQGRPIPFEVADLVPLGYKSTIAGSYTIKLSNYDGLFADGQNVYLEDKVLNVIHNLNDSDYTFVTEEGTFDDRFVLRYTDSALGNHTPTFDENTVVVYHNTTGLHIQSGIINIKNVTIYDISGRRIAYKNGVDNTETSFTTLPQTNQVLLVKIEGENGSTVTKRVVY